MKTNFSAIDVIDNFDDCDFTDKQTDIKFLEALCYEIIMICKNTTDLSFWTEQRFANVANFIMINDHVGNYFYHTYQEIEFEGPNQNMMMANIIRNMTKDDENLQKYICHATLRMYASRGNLPEVEQEIGNFVNVFVSVDAAIDHLKEYVKTTFKCTDVTNIVFFTEDPSMQKYNPFVVKLGTIVSYSDQCLPYYKDCCGKVQISCLINGFRSIIGCNFGHCNDSLHNVDYFIHYDGTITNKTLEFDFIGRGEKNA